MLVMVAYDVNTQEAPGRKRLRRISKACENFGKRVQRSIFECVVDKEQWVVLRSSLLRIMNKEEDSLRFYFLNEEARNKIEHHGIAKPPDFEEPLLI
jgi:CRISPR-associated protein Cas2